MLSMYSGSFKVMHLYCSPFKMQLFVQLFSSWQDFNWHGASRGPSARAELRGWCTRVTVDYTLCDVDACCDVLLVLQLLHFLCLRAYLFLERTFSLTHLPETSGSIAHLFDFFLKRLSFSLKYIIYIDLFLKSKLINAVLYVSDYIINHENCFS